MQCLGFGRPQTAQQNQLPRLLAVRLALDHLKERFGGKHLSATIVYIHRQGGLCSSPMLQLACHILLWSQQHLRLLRAIHIVGLHSRKADELSRAVLPMAPARVQTSGNFMSGP